MSTDCLFCKIAAGQAPARIVFQDAQILAFRDIHPVAPTHVLIVSRKHIENVTKAESGDALLLGKLLLAAAEIAEREEVQDGYRLVVNNGIQSGQAVFHLHVHLLGGRRMGWPPG